MLILRQIFNFIKLLHSETAPGQLCAGFVLGMFMGFTPIMTLHWVAYVLVLVMLRINIGAALLGFGMFKVLAFALDPLFHSTGLELLRMESLKPLWVWMFHAPVIPFTRFNNSVVLGSFIVAALAALPLYFLTRILVIKYRVVVVARIK